LRRSHATCLPRGKIGGPMPRYALPVGATAHDLGTLPLRSGGRWRQPEGGQLFTDLLRREKIRLSSELEHFQAMLRRSVIERPLPPAAPSPAAQGKGTIGRARPHQGSEADLGYRAGELYWSAPGQNVEIPATPCAPAASAAGKSCKPSPPRAKTGNGAGARSAAKRAHPSAGRPG